MMCRAPKLFFPNGKMSGAKISTKIAKATVQENKTKTNEESNVVVEEQNEEYTSFSKRNIENTLEETPRLDDRQAKKDKN